MRIVMMGTGPFAVPTFRSLLESDHEVPMLITRPPRMARGNRKPPPNPMEQVAIEAGLPIEMPESIKEPAAIELLNTLDADLFVVCDYGQILSSEALGAAKLGGINLHASLLPAYRGAAPINWAIYDGCEETGVTVIHMTRRLDAGPNLVQETVKIGETETVVELEERLAILGIDAIHKAIAILSDWDGESEIGEKQDPKLATKAPRLKKTDGQVDWTRTAQQIYDQFRAFQPWPGTFTQLLRTDSEPLRVVLNQIAVVTDNQPHDFTPGQVVENKERFSIATGDGEIRIDAIQPAGKKQQTWNAFLNGYRLEPGCQFGSSE